MPTDKKLKSLVLNVMTEAQYNSATKNEDELYLTPDEGGGGGTLYCHYIAMTKFSGANVIGYIGFNYYNNSSDELNDLTKITSALADKLVLCSGFVKNSATNKFMDVLDITASDGNLIVELFYTIDGLVGSDIIDSTYDIMDTVFQVA